MKKEELSETIRKTISAPSCCKELAAVGKTWLQTENAEEKAKLGKDLLRELKEDVCSIDDLIQMTTTEKAMQMFGTEKCGEMHRAAIEAKGKGVRYCLCDACTNGGKILDDPEGL